MTKYYESEGFNPVEIFNNNNYEVAMKTPLGDSYNQQIKFSLGLLESENMKDLGIESLEVLLKYFVESLREHNAHEFKIYVIPSFESNTTYVLVSKEPRNLEEAKLITFKHQKDVIGY